MAYARISRVVAEVNQQRRKVYHEFRRGLLLTVTFCKSGCRGDPESQCKINVYTVSIWQLTSNQDS